MFFALFVAFSFLNGSALEEFERAIKDKLGPFSQEELNAATKVSLMSWDNPQDRAVLQEGNFKKLIKLLIDPRFYQRDGALAVFKLLFQGPVFAGKNVFYDPGSLDELLIFLLDMIQQGTGNTKFFVDLLDMLDISYIGRFVLQEGSIIILQEKEKVSFKPIARLVAVAQEKNSKSLFDKARAYFTTLGDYNNYASTIIKQMVTGPITDEAVSFAKDLAQKYLDFNSVPEGELKEKIKQLATDWYLWTVEKAMKELEDLVKTKGDRGLIKVHALKVAHFAKESVEKSFDKESLNKRTLQVIASLLESERPGIAEVVGILLRSNTIKDINEKVDFKQVLPLYITHVVQKPGGETIDAATDLLYMIDTKGANSSAVIEDQGKTIPIYAYLAKKTVKNNEIFGDAMFAAFRRVSPAGEKIYGEKEPGFVSNPIIANSMLKIMAQEASENPGSIKNALVKKLAMMVDYGANHRVIPAGAVRLATKNELKKSGYYQVSINNLGKKTVTIPEKPTQKDTVEETIAEIKNTMKQNNIVKAKEVAEDLLFFDKTAVVGKEQQIDNALLDLISQPRISEVIPQVTTFIKTMAENGVLTNKTRLEKEATSVQALNNLRLLATSLKALTT